MNDLKKRAWDVAERVIGNSGYGDKMIIMEALHNERELALGKITELIKQENNEDDPDDLFTGRAHRVALIRTLWEKKED